MNVVRVPVVPIPNTTVLGELDAAIRIRASQIRQDIDQETVPEETQRLVERQGALAFLAEQVKRIRFQVAPIIDIVVDDRSETPKDTTSGAQPAAP